MEEEIKQINKSLRAINDQLHELLSQSHIDLEVNFGENYYRFYMPKNQQERISQMDMRKEFIGELLYDALGELLLSQGIADDQRAWNRVVGLSTHIVRKQDMVSPIAAETYAEIKAEAANDEKAKSLNYDSYYVENERPVEE